MDGASVDRFTARCRLPPARVRARPAAMSRFLLVRDAAASSNTRDALILCRAALQRDDDVSSSSSSTSLHFDATVRLSARTTLLHNLNGAAATADSAAAHWVPKTAVRNAVAVTLTAPADARVWLADYEYRNVLVEILQRHLLLRRHAFVQLPRPSGLVDPLAPALAFQVVSTYPDADFVCVTASTRVTLTAADDKELDDSATTLDHSGDSEEQVAPLIGGLAKEQAALRDLLLLPVKYAALSEQSGVEFPKGLLLCGPPGVGKTLLVRAVVHECRQHIPLQLQTINGAEIMTSGVGDAEAALRRIFKDASIFARQSHGTAVLFIDELDALCPTRDATSGTAHSRVVAQLLTLLDGVDAHARANVIVVGATNLPNAIDPALRRPGRFDRELFLAPPGVSERAEIFRINMHAMPIRGSRTEADARAAFVDVLARKAIGYVGADIAALCREALAVATTRQFVAMTNDRELRDWWRAWQRQSKPLCNANFAAVVAGNAWSANPVAIPLWFLARVKTQAPLLRQRNKRSHFSFLLRSVGTEADEADSVQYTLPAERPTVGDGDDSDPASVAFEVTMADFEQAMQVVVASSLRSATGFSYVRPLSSSWLRRQQALAAHSPTRASDSFAARTLSGSAGTALAARTRPSSRCSRRSSGRSSTRRRSRASVSRYSSGFGSGVVARTTHSISHSLTRVTHWTAPTRHLVVRTPRLQQEHHRPRCGARERRNVPHALGRTSLLAVLWRRRGRSAPGLPRRTGRATSDRLLRRDRRARGEAAL